MKTYIGGQVKTLRKQSGLTQADLGEKIGRTAEAISNVETGKSLPSLDTLIAMSEALNVPLTDFFPSGSVDLDRSANRLKAEAEALTVLRGLTDSQLTVALAQIKALGELYPGRNLCLLAAHSCLSVMTGCVASQPAKAVIRGLRGGSGCQGRQSGQNGRS